MRGIFDANLFLANNYCNDTLYRLNFKMLFKILFHNYQEALSTFENPVIQTHALITKLHPEKTRQNMTA